MEFALTLPVLLLIIFGTIEYGWYLTHCIVMSNAVNQGARAGVKAREWTGKSHGEEDPKLFARNALKEALWTNRGLADGYIQTEIIEADEQGPRRLKVTVADVPYQPVTGYLGKSMLPEKLAAEAVMAFP